MNDDAQCPVCGYYCLGKGGYGCIDKPSLVKQKLVPSAFNENIPTIPDHIPDASKMNCPELPDSWEGVTWNQAKAMYDEKCDQLAKLKAAVEALPLGSFIIDCSFTNAGYDVELQRLMRLLKDLGDRSDHRILRKVKP